MSLQSKTWQHLAGAASVRASDGDLPAQENAVDLKVSRSHVRDHPAMRQGLPFERLGVERDDLLAAVGLRASTF
jgi:hypothetical protein